nr:hypothetical protein [Tanacetum cinerariifolium]
VIYLKIDMTEQMKVWFLREVASEDCFAEDLRDQCSQVRAYMEKRGKMMLALLAASNSFGNKLRFKQERK